VHERLVHDHLRRRRGVVEVGEVRAGDERDAHRPQVARRHGVRERLIVGRVVAGSPLERERPQRHAVDVERDGRRDRGDLNPGQRAQSIEQPGREAPTVLL
jgi:hypothetical protein